MNILILILRLAQNHYPLLQMLKLLDHESEVRRIKTMSLIKVNNIMTKVKNKMTQLQLKWTIIQWGKRLIKHNRSIFMILQKINQTNLKGKNHQNLNKVINILNPQYIQLNQKGTQSQNRASNQMVRASSVKRNKQNPVKHLHNN